MTVQEACSSSSRRERWARRGAGAGHGRAGEDRDVAERLVAQSGRPIEMIFTGLRPGEKMHEELFGDDGRRTFDRCIPSFRMCQFQQSR